MTIASIARSLSARFHLAGCRTRKKVDKLFLMFIVCSTDHSLLVFITMASVVTLPFQLTAPPAEWSKPSAQGKISGKF
jgi:hypothetical protein